MSLPTARRRDGRRGRRWSPQRAGRAACRAPGAPAAPSPRTHLQPRRRSPRPGHLFLSGGSDLDPGLARSNWQAASETRRTALLFRGDDAAEMAFFFFVFLGSSAFRSGLGRGGNAPGWRWRWVDAWRLLGWGTEGACSSLSWSGSASYAERRGQGNVGAVVIKKNVGAVGPSWERTGIGGGV